MREIVCNMPAVRDHQTVKTAGRISPKALILVTAVASLALLVFTAVKYARSEDSMLQNATLAVKQSKLAIVWNRFFLT